MKKTGFIIGVAMVAILVSTATEANAQLRKNARHADGAGLLKRTPVYAGADADGMTMTQYDGRVNMLRSVKMASHNNPYTPHRFYTYRSAGIEAGRTHSWNQQEAACRPWHGEYQNWRWREPTALVVPPTAGYITNYGWGVGQVRSTPIHHQFGRSGAGMIGGGTGNDYKWTPYWPSDTEQFGLYPVRAPW